MSSPFFSVSPSVSVALGWDWVSISGRFCCCGSYNLESMAWLMKSRCLVKSSNLHWKAWIAEEREARSSMDFKKWGFLCCCCGGDDGGCC